jgi:AP-1 complex subunit mu
LVIICFYLVVFDSHGSLISIHSMVLSSLFFLDLKGKILISRDYRGDISAHHAEEFIDLLAEREIELEASAGDIVSGRNVCNVQPPIFHKDGISYCYIKHNNLYCKITK